jgi:hypothetical protein
MEIIIKIIEKPGRFTSGEIIDEDFHYTDFKLNANYGATINTFANNFYILSN